MSACLILCNVQVRDEKGRKMSKTLGNVVDPVDVIETHGTDALRFTLATGVYADILQINASPCIDKIHSTRRLYVIQQQHMECCAGETVTATSHTRVCSSDSPHSLA